MRETGLRAAKKREVSAADVLRRVLEEEIARVEAENKYEDLTASFFSDTRAGISSSGRSKLTKQDSSVSVSSSRSLQPAAAVSPQPSSRELYPKQTAAATSTTPPPSSRSLSADNEVASSSSKSAAGGDARSLFHQRSFKNPNPPLSPDRRPSERASDDGRPSSGASLIGLSSAGSSRSPKSFDPRESSLSSATTSTAAELSFPSTATEPSLASIAESAEGADETKLSSGAATHGSRSGGASSKMLGAAWQGYLMKKSPALLKRWQSRFVAVKDNRMMYSKSDSSIDSEPLGEVPLVGARVQLEDDEKNKEHRIIISYMNESDRNFFFYTKDKGDRDRAAAVMKECIHAQNLGYLLCVCKMGDEESGSGSEGDDDDEADNKLADDEEEQNVNSSAAAATAGDDESDSDNDGTILIPSFTPPKIKKKDKKNVRHTDMSASSTIDVQLRKLMAFCTEEERLRIITYVDSKTAQTALHIAASHGASRVVLSLQSYLPKDMVNAKDAFQQTPLTIALVNKNTNTALALLDFPTLDHTYKNDKGNTFLHMASGCDRSVILRLLERGINPLEANVLGSIPHHEMAQRGNAAALEELLSKNASVINQRGSKDGYAPLHWAALEGHVATIKVLLKYGADTALQSHNGNTALHVAINQWVERSIKKKDKKVSGIKYHKQFSAICIALINAGSNLEFPSREGKTALTALCSIEPEFTNLQQKKFVGDEVFRLMIEKGRAKVSVRSGKGYQPIHYAAVVGNFPLVKMLIDFGADVNALSSERYSALNLVENKQNTQGASVILGKTYKYMLETIKVLLENGAIRRAHADVPIELSNSEITYMRNNVDGKYQMKSATVPQMIARITHRVFYSTSDVYSFLLQYDIFTNPIEILTCLKARFFPENAAGDYTATEIPSNVDLDLLGDRRSVLAFIETWLASSPECFLYDDSDYTMELAKIAVSIMDTKSIPAIQEKLEPIVLEAFADFVQYQHKQLWADKWSEQHKHLLPEKQWSSSSGGVVFGGGGGGGGGVGAAVTRERGASRAESSGAPSLAASSVASLSLGDIPKGGADFTSYERILDLFFPIQAKGSGNERKSNKLLGRGDDAVSQTAFRLLDASSQELAQQLTLLTHTLFCQVPVEEFVDGRYKKIETGANFHRLKNATNRISFVLMSLILKEEDLIERANVMKLLILTAENCLMIENFDMFVSIISVLGSSAIHRLKQSWARVHKLIPKKWDAIQSASGGAGRNLEKKMAILKPPCVPCIGLVLRMLINLNEEPLRIEEEGTTLINFHKLRKIGGVFQMIDTAKSVPYSFPMNIPLLTLLSSAPLYCTENDCWARSKAIEETTKAE